MSPATFGNGAYPQNFGRRRWWWIAAHPSFVKEAAWSGNVTRLPRNLPHWVASARNLHSEAGIPARGAENGRIVGRGVGVQCPARVRLKLPVGGRQSPRVTVM